ncbi:MAG: hypothetical protein AAGM84_17730 [Pseudomonadota bacterium]
MDLRDFVVSAISDISEAVSEADKLVKPLGGIVNPGSNKFRGEGKYEFVASRTSLNFDIAVTASKAGTGEVGGKAKIWVVEAKLGAAAETSNQTVSRLTFSVDVVLPHDSSQLDRVGKVQTKA